MATLATQNVSLTGLSPAYTTAAGGGDKFRPRPDTFLHVVNGSGGSITVTVDSKRPSDYGTDVNIAVAVPAGQERMIGPFDPGRFAGAGGLADVSYSGVTSLTVAVIRIPGA
ncbi:MAG TPA: hypothetical protein VGB14_00345 [Acidimicrobiales bacterium]|jgi:hypothetical protein